jgi:hypothetical protein
MSKPMDTRPSPNLIGLPAQHSTAQRTDHHGRQIADAETWPTHVLHGAARLGDHCIVFAKQVDGFHASACTVSNTCIYQRSCLLKRMLPNAHAPRGAFFPTAHCTSCNHLHDSFIHTRRTRDNTWVKHYAHSCSLPVTATQLLSTWHDINTCVTDSSPPARSSSTLSTDHP